MPPNMTHDNLEQIKKQIEGALAGTCGGPFYKATPELSWPILLLSETFPDILAKLRFFLVPQDDPDLLTVALKADVINFRAAGAVLGRPPDLGGDLGGYSGPGGRLKIALEAAIGLIYDTDVQKTTSHTVLWDHAYHPGPCRCVD